MQPTIVSHEDWLIARKAHLAKELEMTHALDALRAERRQLPWVRVEKVYVFNGSDGKCTLLDLFGDRSQLAVSHFMLTPDSDHICPGCSYTMDHVDAARQHFEQADLAFAAISRAPIARIEQVRSRMGWNFTWASSGDGDFNYDFGVTFTEADRAAGHALYNYDKIRIQRSPDMFGVSVLARDTDDGVYHTYSTYHRGTELLMGAFNWLALTPKGRNETSGTMSRVRLHDEYPQSE